MAKYMRCAPLRVAPLLFVALLSQHADAHLRITSHQARYGDDQKPSPCGRIDGERTTDKVYIAKPGTEVTLVWDEFINHPSFFRIDFDLDGADFVTPVVDCADKTSIADCFDTTNTGPYMVNNITDEAAAVQNYVYTLPNVECNNCTLQVIQAMHDKPPYEVNGNEIYHQCIDIILSNTGPDTLTLVEAVDTPDAGSPVDTPDAGSPVDTPDAGSQSGDPDAGSPVTVNGSGCSLGGHAASPGSLGLLFLGLGLALCFPMRRRAKR